MLRTERSGWSVHLLAVALMGLSVGYLGFVGVSWLNAAKAAIPFLLAATLVNTGRYVSAHGFDLRQSLRVATWGVGTLLGAGWMAFVILFVLLVDGIVVEDSLFIFLTSMNGGAAAGAALGAKKVHVAREQERLADERARVERMNQRLRVINRVLRHNFQNKLNVLKMWAGRVTDEVETDIVANHSETIPEMIGRLEELTEKTRNLEVVNEHDTRVPLDLETIAEQQVRAVRSDHPELSVRTDLEPGVTVRAHRMLETAVDELLENAVEHNDPATVSVAVELGTDDERGEAVLTIADDGTGVPEDERAVVETGDETPLFHGSGMGLWLVRAIVTESEGEFSIESADSVGTVVELRLPTADEATASTAPTAESTAPTPASTPPEPPAPGSGREVASAVAEDD